MSVQRGVWFKSSKSGPNCDNCVEVRVGPAVDVRDTKDRGGPALAFVPAGWQSFVSKAARGGFTPPTLT